MHADPGASNWGALAVLTADPGGTAILTDFDGSIAPIVGNPGDARPLPGAVEALAALAERFGVVGVISGRPASYLMEHLGGVGDRVRLIGLYGLERVVGNVVRTSPEAEAWRGTVDRVVDAARGLAPPGVVIESKGISVTLHWRGAVEQESWAVAFGTQWCKSSGLTLQSGRLAIELRPPIPGDKGMAVEELSSGCSAACFLGDDQGDLPAFAALERLAASGMSTVRIAVGSIESPDALLASADLVVEGPDEALAVLKHLAQLPAL